MTRNYTKKFDAPFQVFTLIKFLTRLENKTRKFYSLHMQILLSFVVRSCSDVKMYKDVYSKSLNLPDRPCLFNFKLSL